jgi:hypothetical protein
MATWRLFPAMRLGVTITMVLRARLQKLADKITAAAEHCNYRVFMDSAPVMEVEWAQKSGLGWRGKHTLLLSREAGSMFFLGEIYTDMPVTVDTLSATIAEAARSVLIFALPVRLSHLIGWMRGAAFLTLRSSIRATSPKLCVP